MMGQRSARIACLWTWGLFLGFSVPHPVFASPSPPLLSSLAPPETTLPLRSQEERGCSEVLSEPPLSGAVLSLQDALNRSLCRHPELAEAWANLLAQEAQVGITQAAFLPTLTAKLSEGSVRRSGDASTQSSLAATATWLLYDFGARDENRRAALSQFRAVAWAHQAKIQTIFQSTVRIFTSAQTAREGVTSALLSEASAARSLAVAEARYAAGVATPADRLQARTAHAQAHLARLRAETERDQAFGELSILLGHPPEITWQLPAVEIPTASSGEPPLFRPLLAEALKQRPDLLAAEAAVNASRAQHDATLAATRPALSLSAEQSRLGNPSGWASTGNLFLNVSVPLFTGFEHYYRIRLAEAQTAVREAQRDRQRQTVEQEVWQAYQAMTSSWAAVQAASVLLESATQSEAVAAGRYEAGVGTILEWLTAQAALASARQQQITVGQAWRLARLNLAYALGRLDRLQGDF